MMEDNFTFDQHEPETVIGLPAPTALPPAADTGWLDRKLRLSINAQMIDKNAAGDARLFAEGFVSQALTPAELMAEVLRGHAYCAEMKGKRLSSNFVASDLVSIDVDGTMTLEDALAHPFCQQHLTFYYTTASHRPDSHRFRLGFAVERTIDDADDMRATFRSLVLKFSADASAVDPCRMFFGSTNAQFEVFDRGIPADILDRLIAQSRGSNQTDTQTERRASVRSDLQLESDCLVRSVKHGNIPLDQLRRSDALHCPFHKDDHASAFVVTNQAGQNGIRCSTCVQTFWPKGEAAPFAFNSFVKSAKELAEVKRPPKGIEQFFDSQDGDDSHLRAAKIEIVRERFLSQRQISPGATFIKSPKGSGKTQLLEELAKIDGARILLVGHRRSLIRSMCNRLGLQCYLTDEGIKPFTDQDQYGICLDSLLKVRADKPYDYLLLDESEQVFAHLLSDTIGDKRDRIWKRLQHLVGKARHVIALDADLGWNTFLRICEWRAQAASPGENSLLINEFVRPRGKIYLVPNRQQLFGEVHQAVKDGKRCFVTSNSRAAIEKLEASLIDANKDTQLISITSKSSQSGDHRHIAFLADPKQESTKYQVVLASPSLGTGVDFSFSREEDRFDIVFGIFERLVLTHFECDQQLARVRDPRSVRVYISPMTFRFETDIDTVTQDVLNFDMMGYLVAGYNDAGQEQYLHNAQDDSLLKIAASVITTQRASKNDLRSNFVAYVEQQGWEVRYAASNKTAKSQGSIAEALGLKLSKDHAIKRLIGAQSMNSGTYKETKRAIENAEPVDPAARLSYVRTGIERFYCLPLAPGLILDDYDGRLRKQVLLFEDVTNEVVNGIAPLQTQDQKARQLAEHVKSRESSALLMCSLLDTTPLFSAGKFNCEIEFQTADLADFVELVTQFRLAYETQFELPVRADLEKKPVLELNRLLRHAGLETRNTRKTKSGGSTTYFYQLKSEYLMVMEQIAKTRRLGRMGDADEHDD